MLITLTRVYLARNALLCASEMPSQTPPTDVKQSLNGTGLFDVIDAMDCRAQTPTLSQLMNYDSVMIWSRASFQNATFLGDVLADYVDSGRTVVAAYDSFHPTLGVNGRLSKSNYLPFTTSSVVYNGFRNKLVAVNRSHPLLNGVNAFDGKENCRLLNVLI